LLDFAGAPEEIQTPDPQIRSLTLLQIKQIGVSAVPVVEQACCQWVLLAALDENFAG